MHHIFYMAMPPAYAERTKQNRQKKYAVCMQKVNKAEPNRNAGCLHAQDEQSRHIQYMGPWLNLDRATGFGLSFFKKRSLSKKIPRGRNR